MVRRYVGILAFIIPGILLRIENVQAACLSNVIPEENLIDRDNPDYSINVYPRFRTSGYNKILDEDDDSWKDSKRGLDLGLGRGYSGSLAAKQRIGWAAANFAGGPGRRRRNGFAG